MLGKRGMSEGVVGHGTRRARPRWIKLNCLNLNPNLVDVHAHRKNACKRCPMLCWHEPEAGTLSAWEEAPTRSRHGMSEDPKVWLGRISKMYHGIAYGGRPPRQQSARSSRGSHAPPGSAGKRHTGQRSTGTLILRKARYAQCRTPQQS